MAEGDRTSDLEVCVDRYRMGDDSARELLLEQARGRLERLARKMLRGFPGVGRWGQTDDVLQGALIRLDRCLRAGPPTLARHFLRLAAVQFGVNCST